MTKKKKKKLTAGLTSYGARVWSTGDDIPLEDIQRLKKAQNFCHELNVLGKKRDDAWRKAVYRVTGAEVTTRFRID